jgi:adenylate kinase family enzyme
VRRILVCGITGSGKTTFARELAQRLDLPYHEMDALFHGPDWTPIPTFVEDVERLAAEDAWVLDSQGYAQVRDLLWSRADAAVWLDYSRPVVMRRVLTRSAARALDRRELFNGNTESFRDWLDPEHPVQWSMRAYAARKTDMEGRFADPRYAGMSKVRLRRPAAARWWLDRVG